MRAILFMLCLAATAQAAVPNAPTNLVLVPGDKQMKLSWRDNSGNETGFEINRTQDPTGTWKKVTTVSTNTTIYTDRYLWVGTKYFYRVRAFNAQGSSAWSPVASATTLGTSPTATPSPGPSTSPTGSPTASPTISPTVSPSPSLTPTATPTPTPTATATPTPTLTPIPTSTPSATATPSPTLTPSPAQTRTVTIEIVTPTQGDAYELYYSDTNTGQWGAPVATLTGAINAGIPSLTVGETYYFANKVTRNGTSSVMSDPLAYTVTSAQTQVLKVPGKKNGERPN